MAPTVILMTGTNRGKSFGRISDQLILIEITGIGKGLAKAYLAKTNTTVIATVRKASVENITELSSLPRDPNSQLIIIPLSLDVPSTVAEGMRKIRTQNGIGHIDVVIANAGICNHWGPVLNMTDSDLLSHFEVNTLGTLRLFRATASLLQSSDRPKFVCLSSELASIAGLEQSGSLTTAYGVSKAASNYVVKKFHEEHESLVAFSVDPGFVQTDMGNRGAQCNGLEKAPMTIDESVCGIINQIDMSTKTTTSGKFIGFDGTLRPW